MRRRRRRGVSASSSREEELAVVVFWFAEVWRAEVRQFCCSGVVVVVDARCTSEVARRREDGVCCRIMVVADEDGGCRGFWCVAGDSAVSGELTVEGAVVAGEVGGGCVEGGREIRVRVLGDEDDDVARSEWSIG